jgi:hypothetical protein
VDIVLTGTDDHNPDKEDEVKNPGQIRFYSVHNRPISPLLSLKEALEASQ